MAMHLKINCRASFYPLQCLHTCIKPAAAHRWLFKIGLGTKKKWGTWGCCAFVQPGGESFCCVSVFCICFECLCSRQFVICSNHKCAIRRNSTHSCISLWFVQITIIAHSCISLWFVQITIISTQLYQFVICSNHYYSTQLYQFVICSNHYYQHTAVSVCDLFKSLL